MKSKPARFSSTEWPRARASGLLSPTISPPARRSTAPVTCSRASIRVVLPALVGPTSAKARTDPAGWIGMVVLPSPLAPRTHIGWERIPGAVLGRSRTGSGARAARMDEAYAPARRQVRSRISASLWAPAGLEPGGLDGVGHHGEGVGRLDQQAHAGNAQEDEGHPPEVHVGE